MMWTARIEGGPSRINHAAVLVGDKIYSFGGYCSTADYQNWGQIPVYVLNTDTMRWSLLDYSKPGDYVPFQRFGHTAVAYDGKVYIWGGRNNAQFCWIVVCFDTKTLQWTNPMVKGQVPFAKDGHSACLIKNRMYVFAGFENQLDLYSQELYYLNLDTLEWHCVQAEGEIPSPRDFHSATAIGDRMYVYGGRGDMKSPRNTFQDNYCPHLFYLDTIEEKWYRSRSTGARPDTRRSHSAWAHNGNLYIFGGYNGISKEHFNDFWRYSPANDQWYKMSVNGPPSPRRRQASVMYGNKTFTFGGSSLQYAEVTADTSDEPPSKKRQLVAISDMHVLDFAPTLKTMAMCAVLKYKLDYTTVPWILQMEIRCMSVPNRIIELSSKKTKRLHDCELVLVQ